MLELEKRVAQALLAINAVGFNVRQPLTFKSGIKSPVYVDNRRLPFFPDRWRIIIEGFQEVIQTRALQFDIIAGIAVGGIPHSATLAYQLRRPSVFIRKDAKEHGTQSKIEGGEINNKTVLLIEDMVTTGGSLLHGINALRNAGATVNTCLAITTYGFAEAYEALDKAQVTIYPLTTFGTILTIASESGKVDAADQPLIKDWLDDPYGWATRHGL